MHRLHRRQHEVGKAKAAPRRAQNAKPRNSVFGIEHGAGERSGIQNFGTIFQVLKFDGTKWDSCLAEGRRDGGQRGARAAKYGNSILLTVAPGGLHSIEMATDECDDLVGL